MHPRAYPRWVIDSTNATDPAGEPAVQWRACAGVRAFVRKTGKAGMGITLEVRSRTDCPATITRAAVVIPDHARRLHAEATVPVIPELRGRSLRYLWMPVHFDADELWNRGARVATLELELAIDGVAQPAITWPLVTLWSGPFL